MLQEDVNTHMKEKYEDEVGKKKNKSRKPSNKFKILSAELSKQKSSSSY